MGQGTPFVFMRIDEFDAFDLFIVFWLKLLLATFESKRDMCACEYFAHIT